MSVIAPALPSETYALRLAVLAPGGALTMADAEAAPPSMHLAAREEDGRVVGSVHLDPAACPWRPDAGSPWQLRTMAIDPSLQGGGTGRALVHDGVARVRAAGGDLLWCNARVAAEGFYGRLGFAPVSEPFVQSGIVHLGMVLPL